MSTPLPSSNTDSIAKSDRSVVGNQPDSSTATGGPTPSTPTGGISLNSLQAIPANSVVLNAAPVSASPQDLTMAASTTLARLASGNIVAATPTQLTTMLAGTAPVSATVTVALAQLTPVTGTQGSLTLTVVKGLITVLTYVAPT